MHHANVRYAQISINGHVSRYDMISLPVARTASVNCSVLGKSGVELGQNWNVTIPDEGSIGTVTVETSPAPHHTIPHHTHLLRGSQPHPPHRVPHTGHLISRREPAAADFSAILLEESGLANFFSITDRQYLMIPKLSSTSRDFFTNSCATSLMGSGLSCLGKGGRGWGRGWGTAYTAN